MSESQRRLPPLVIDDKLVSRFWKKVDRREQSDCWPWLASVRSSYGAIRISGHTYLSHRVAYEITNGPVAESLVVGHNCDNKLCCNPKHLEAITVHRNNVDAVSRIKFYRPKGSDKSNSVLTESDVTQIREVRAKTGFGWRRIAALLNLPCWAVKGVIEGKNWKHIQLPEQATA